VDAVFDSAAAAALPQTSARARPTRWWAAALVAVGLVFGSTSAAHADAKPRSAPVVFVAAQQAGAPHGGSTMRPDAKFTWGWISGTLYLNRSETKKASTTSTLLDGLGALTGVLKGSLGSLASILLSWVKAQRAFISRVAGGAVHAGKCVKIKIYGLFFTLGTYSGGYCS
jgi:hypothetical protein